MVLCVIQDGDDLTHLVFDHNGRPKEIWLTGRGHRPAVAAVHLVLSMWTEPTKPTDQRR